MWCNLHFLLSPSFIPVPYYHPTKTKFREGMPVNWPYPTSCILRLHTECCPWPYVRKVREGRVSEGRGNNKSWVARKGSKPQWCGRRRVTRNRSSLVTLGSGNGSCCQRPRMCTSNNDDKAPGSMGYMSTQRAHGALSITNRFSRVDFLFAGMHGVDDKKNDAGVHRMLKGKRRSGWWHAMWRPEP